jgi:hypothetical protein
MKSTKISFKLFKKYLKLADVLGLEFKTLK